MVIMGRKFGGYKFHEISDLGNGYYFGYDEPFYYYQLEYKDILLLYGRLKMLKNKYVQNFLQNLVVNLENFIKQLNKSGVNSELSIYIYQEYSKQYVSNVRNYDYPWLTENIDNSLDFSELWSWHRKLILWRLNLGLLKEEKFRFKNMIKLSGGNFGPNRTDISVNGSENKDVSLSELDNLSMKDM